MDIRALLFVGIYLALGVFEYDPIDQLAAKLRGGSEIETPQEEPI